MTVSNEELVKRIVDLEAQLAELKAQLPKEEKPFEPTPMPKIDYTEGMSASGSAIKAMVDLINPKGLKFDPSAWARNRYPEPGGFGPPSDGKWDKGAAKVRPEEELKIPPRPWSGWSK
jgi:hypothetical protein